MFYKTTNVTWWFDFFPNFSLSKDELFMKSVKSLLYLYPPKSSGPERSVQSADPESLEHLTEMNGNLKTLVIISNFSQSKIAFHATIYFPFFLSFKFLIFSLDNPS